MTGTSGNQSHAKSACATAAPLCATRWSARTRPTAPTQWFPTTSAAPSAQTTVRRLDSHASGGYPPLPWANKTTSPLPTLKVSGNILMDPQHSLPWILKYGFQASSLMVIHWINLSLGSWSSRPKSRLKASNLIGENQRLIC